MHHTTTAHPYIYISLMLIMSYSMTTWTAEPKDSSRTYIEISPLPLLSRSAPVTSYIPASPVTQHMIIKDDKPVMGDATPPISIPARKPKPKRTYIPRTDPSPLTLPFPVPPKVTSRGKPQYRTAVICERP